MPINVPSVNAGAPIEADWGNTVDLAITELQNDKIGETGGTMTGSLIMTNGATIAGIPAPGASGHAANKAYVDSTAAAELDTKISKAGSSADRTMTYPLIINAQTTTECLKIYSDLTVGSPPVKANSPYIGWYDSTGTIRYGYIQMAGAPGTAAMYIRPQGTLDMRATTTVYIGSGTNHDITLNSGGGQVRSSDSIYAQGGLRSFTTHAQASACQLIGTEADCHVEFFGAGASIDSTGGRYGWMGYYLSGHMQFNNENTSASIFHKTDYAHVFESGTTRAEVARILPGAVLVGKASASLAAIGIELYEKGSVYATRAEPDGLAPLYLNITGSGAARMIEFRRNNSYIGMIETVSTTGIKLTSGSDRRMKNIVGPITNAIARVKAMKPYRVSWVDDPERGETDAFIADEMMSIVPEAVSGTPNAVAGPPQNDVDPPEGTPIMQGMSYEKLMTVTIAALQNVIGRVEALEGAT